MKLVENAPNYRATTFNDCQLVAKRNDSAMKRGVKFSESKSLFHCKFAFKQIHA